MSRTFYHDFARDDGSSVMVSYTFSAGSESSYSPRSGAYGGDPCEVEIVKSWLKAESGDDQPCALTDKERERMEEWLVENHVDDDYDDWEF